MQKQSIRKKGYLSNLTSSLQNLWSAQEMLAPRNIRKRNLPYFFAFPVAMAFINIQDYVIDDGWRAFGLANSTLTFISFALGAMVMFAFSKERNIALISKISALITMAGFLPWLFLPGGYPSLVCSIVFMAGVGGCLSSSSFSFVFMLNNTERFFGSTMIVLFIGLIELLDGYVRIPRVVQLILITLMLMVLCLCMFLSKSGDYNGKGNKEVKKLDPSIWLVFFIFFSYFAIRITGFYASAFQRPANSFLWGGLALCIIVSFVIIQVLFKRTIWTLCNVFFITSILSHLMWYVDLPKAAYLFSEIKELGLMITFFLLGCVTNKFCNFRIHKYLVLISMAGVGVLYLGIDLLHEVMPTEAIAVVTSSVLFILFLMLSPAFSQYLFFADWSKEFRLICMSSEIGTGSIRKIQKDGIPIEEQRMPSLDDTRLSPREKQVVCLLLQGMTLRQVAPELGLTPATVATYSKTIYKKLGINSRAELFIMFGHSQKAMVLETDDKA